MNWAAKAEALGNRFPKCALHADAVDALESTQGAVGIACSGGADSVAALLLVYHHFPELRDRLIVLHFNHKLRESASKQDESFVLSVGRSLQLEGFSDSWDDVDLSKPTSEAIARAARQAFFDRFIDAHPGALIVTGHQKEDVLETLMLRIARSSDLVGLAAPRPVSVFQDGKTIVRPLLSLRKSDLVQGLSELGIDWREDETNQTAHFDRNRLRNDVIPEWQAATQFDLVDAAARIRETMQSADELVERYLDIADFPDADENPVVLPRPDAPRAAVRRWLVHWLEARNVISQIQRSLLDEITAAVRRGRDGKWSVGAFFVSIKDGVICSERAEISDEPVWDEKTLYPDQSLIFPNGKELSCRRMKMSEMLLLELDQGKYSEASTVLIDSENVDVSSFIVRTWSPGDRYRALNAPGSRKLQDMFVDRKIPKEERFHLPVVLTPDSVILWCPGLPVNHNCRVTEKTKEILQLTYT